MTMKAICIIFTLILALPAFGQSIEGSWKISAKDDQGVERTAVITFGSDSSLKVDLNSDGTIDITGNYTLEGDKVTIKDAQGEMACEGAGTFQYAITGDEMRFSLVQDPCQGRHMISAVPLKRQ